MTSNEIVYRIELPLMDEYYKLIFNVRWYWKEFRKTYQLILEDRYGEYAIFVKEHRTRQGAYLAFSNKVDLAFSIKSDLVFPNQVDLIIAEHRKQYIVDALELIKRRYDVIDENINIVYRYGV